MAWCLLVASRKCLHVAGVSQNVGGGPLVQRSFAVHRLLPSVTRAGVDLANCLRRARMWKSFDIARLNRYNRSVRPDALEGRTTFAP